MGAELRLQQVTGTPASLGMVSFRQPEDQEQR
jgi:hypothetical protein